MPTRGVNAAPLAAASTSRGGEKIDWQAAQALWGTRFPKDYMAFMPVYGVGGIGSEEEIGDVGILAPFPTGAYELSPDDLEDETGNARETCEEEGADQDELDLDPEHILARGYTPHADILCRLTSDPDPDKWPVLLFARHGSVPCEVVPWPNKFGGGACRRTRACPHGFARARQRSNGDSLDGRDRLRRHVGGPGRRPA
jgi:hypothetical protein